MKNQFDPAAGALWVRACACMCPRCVVCVCRVAPRSSAVRLRVGVRARGGGEAEGRRAAGSLGCRYPMMHENVLEKGVTLRRTIESYREGE